MDLSDDLVDDLLGLVRIEDGLAPHQLGQAPLDEGVERDGGELAVDGVGGRDGRPEGGPDGLDAYRILAPEILRVLRPGGRFLVEIGYDQRAAVEALFRQAGALEVETLPDLSTHDRVVTGVKKPLETGV